MHNHIQLVKPEPGTTDFLPGEGCKGMPAGGWESAQERGTSGAPLEGDRERGRADGARFLLNRSASLVQAVNSPSFFNKQLINKGVVAGPCDQRAS